MNLKIREEILKSATKCKKDFSCLSGERKDLCKVELCIGDKLHFIKCMNSNPCSYRTTFGYSFVCTCPVRKELYIRYNL
ncbi:MAG: hypothetical protein Q8N79_05800 [Candidatus Methanoperedens sp.]|nr:hypothetical protein [Candidatus Methanoperedens sp.]